MLRRSRMLGERAAAAVRFPVTVLGSVDSVGAESCVDHEAGWWMTAPAQCGRTSTVACGGGKALADRNPAPGNPHEVSGGRAGQRYTGRTWRRIKKPAPHWGQRKDGGSSTTRPSSRQA